MTARPRYHWSSAEFVESRVLPILCAFGLGVVLANQAEERRSTDRLSQANRATQQALQEAKHQMRLANLYAEACGPLLSMPVESTPELIAAAPQGDARTQGGAR